MHGKTLSSPDLGWRHFRMGERMPCVCTACRCSHRYWFDQSWQISTPIHCSHYIQLSEKHKRQACRHGYLHNYRCQYVWYMPTQNLEQSLTILGFLKFECWVCGLWHKTHLPLHVFSGAVHHWKANMALEMSKSIYQADEQLHPWFISRHCHSRDYLVLALLADQLYLFTHLDLLNG